MDIIRNILGRVFAFWAMLVFIVTMLILYIPFLITGLWSEPRRTIYFIRLSRIWMKLFFTFSGVRRIFKGRQNFKKGENYIVVCNHNTFMDIPLSSPGIPGLGNKTIAKIEMAKIPLFGIMYQRGSVLVDRKSEESRKSSFIKMKDVLDMGLHMCIYPEGTRNKTKDPLTRFHDGAFKLSIDSGHAVVPAVIFHSRKVLPPGKKFFFWPHKMEMHFLAPIAPDGMNVETLKGKVFDTMKNYFVENNTTSF
jgi:1-acyl-sn-glycerol-3-phosphate acyltransferase